MKPMKKNVALGICLFLFVGLVINKFSLKHSREKEYSNFIQARYKAVVSKVIDGDTIEIKFTDEYPNFCNACENVRFIGIDTPELNLHKDASPDFYANEAFQFTKRELLNNEIEIKFDKISETRDKYQRLVAYVYIDDFLFNKILLEQGCAFYYPNFKFNPEKMEMFKKAENYARNQKAGIWRN